MRLVCSWLRSVRLLQATLFPSTLFLDVATQAELTPPGSLAEILKNLLLSFVANPVVAIAEANFIGILAWAVALGIALPPCYRVPPKHC